MKQDYPQLEGLNENNLLNLVLTMQQQLVEQGTLLQEMRARLTKDDCDSNKLPDSNRMKKPKPRSRRQASQPTVGGEADHKDDTLKVVTEPEGVEPHDMSKCPYCQCDWIYSRN